MTTPMAWPYVKAKPTPWETPMLSTTMAKPASKAHTVLKYPNLFFKIQNFY
jgi:hypothetical protein